MEKNTLKRNENIRQEALTFRKLSKLWLQIHHISIKTSTYIKYIGLLKRHIYPLIGDVDVKSLTRSSLNEIVTNKLNEGRLGGGGLSPSYVRSISVIINAVLQFGYQENMCSDLRITRTIPNPVTYYPLTLTLSEQQLLERYISSNPSITAAAILLALHAGLRIGEVCGLRWDDVNLSSMILSVRRTAVRSYPGGETSYALDYPKTRSSIREIPLTKALGFLLEAIYPQRCSEYVVSDRDGFLQPPTLEYRYHRFLERAKVRDLNFHALRHTFATRCIEAGVDDKTLSELLGHSNVSVTLGTYVHSSMSLKKQQIMRLSLMLKGE